MYKEIMTTDDGTQYTKNIQETLAPPVSGSDKKARQRMQIERDVFDLRDSVADNAKFLSLLTSLVLRMYNIMPEEQKVLLDPNDRALTEYVFNTFLQTETRADVQIQEEGSAFIDKMLERQASIGKIIKEIK